MHKHGTTETHFDTYLASWDRTWIVRKVYCSFTLIYIALLLSYGYSTEIPSLNIGFMVIVPYPINL